MDAAIELHDDVGDALGQAFLLRRQQVRCAGERGDQSEATELVTRGMSSSWMGAPNVQAIIY